MLTVRQNMLAFVLVFFMIFQAAHAEPEEITLDIQNGSNYMGMIVMKNMFWDAVAKQNGISTKLNLNRVGGPSAAADRFLAGANQGMTISYPLIIKLHEKTKGDAKILVGNALVNMMLNVSDPSIKSAADFKEGNKIAVTTIETSIQAIASKKLAQKTFGDTTKLDRFSVQMSHPDAYAALMVKKITAHWATPPFAQMEIENKQNVTIARSFDLFGPHHLTALAVSEKFCHKNPLTCKTIYDAYSQANAWIVADQERAANYFKANMPVKEDADDYLSQFKNKDLVFEVAPQGIMSFYRFLKEIKQTNVNLNSWKDITLPYVHNLKGS
jgi:NitT/TauT family transport system substrate-binding protein